MGCEARKHDENGLIRSAITGFDGKKKQAEMVVEKWEANPAMSIHRRKGKTYRYGGVCMRALTMGEETV